MKLKGTIYVLGRVGPFSLVTDEALDSIAEKLEKPGEHVVPVRAGRDLILGRLVGVERVNATPDTRGLELTVEIDESTIPAEHLGALTATSDALAAAVREDG